MKDDNSLNNNNQEQNLNNENIPPCASDEKIVINTIDHTKKKSSLLPIFIIIIVLLLGISYMDKIMSLFDKNKPIINTPTEKDEYEEYNLVDGFIVIDDNSAYMKLDKIKFYNFRKSKTDNILTLNYLSDTNYEDTKDLGLYIELYNAEKELLYKELYSSSSVSVDSIKTYTMSLNNDVYPNIKYAKVKKYTKEELNSKQELVCRYKVNEQGFTVTYKNTFNFINNELQSYSVHKEINVLVENTISKRYQNEIKEENDKMTSLNIETKYENNKLDYTIDVTKEIENFIPIYEYKVTPSIIKTKEVFKKWECE